MKLYSTLVTAAFSCFLLTFLYAVVRWVLADAKSRDRSGGLLATIMVAVPVTAVMARNIFRPIVSRSLMASVALGVPFMAWIVWLCIRPTRNGIPRDPIFCGRDDARSRWILVLSLAASGYGVAVVWLTQLVMYPMFLSVPPTAFLEYYSNFQMAIVVPVIVALSLSWVLSALLILHHPKAIPSWAPWCATALALIGFIASQALEAPYNEQLLAHGFNADTIRTKIAFNWFRLLAWTLQAVLLAWMTCRALAGSGPKQLPENGAT